MPPKFENGRAAAKPIWIYLQVVSSFWNEESQIVAK